MRTKNSIMVFFTIAVILGSAAALSSFSNTSIAFAKHELSS